jgi:hypothetical protein
VALMITTNAALFGALSGLTLGLLEYVIVLRLIGRAVAIEAAQGGEMEGVALVTRRMRQVRVALLGCAFVLLPAVGFALGSTFGSDTGYVQ